MFWETARLEELLKQLDLSKKEIFLNEGKLNVGFAVEFTISELKRKDLVTLSEVSKFKKQCFNFLVATAGKLFERSPLGFMIVKHARCLNPEHFSSNAVESMKLLLNLLLYLF